MKVSIVIAVYNSHKVVVRQIRHFKRMELPDDIEIIFVDDGSTPPLKYRMGLRNFTIYYTHDKRPWTQGLARNLGASKAKGKYVFFTDIDHILTKEAIEAARIFDGDKMVFRRMFGFLNQHGQIISDVESVLKFGLSRRRFRQRGLNGGFHGNTYIIKKEVFNLLGGYDPRYCESGFHVGKKYMSEERNFNNKYDRMVKRDKLLPSVVGPNIYVFPTSRFRQDGNNNPHGLFHNLSLEQVPQPVKP